MAERDDPLAERVGGEPQPHSSPTEHRRHPEGARFPRGNRSYARMAGRLSPTQERAMEEWGHLVVTPTNEFLTAVDPSFMLDGGTLFGNDRPVLLEVGSGTGTQAVAYASAHPEVNVVAVEVWREGIADTLLAGHDLPNLRVVRADAATLLHGSAAPGSLAEVWTYFPDPWRKARHAKRRIVNERFAADVTRALVPGGIWRLATDWADYAAHMHAVLAATSLTVVPADRGPRVVTKYEEKARRAGRAVHEFWAVRDA